MTRLASEIREQAWRADELINTHRGVIERLNELTKINLKTMNAEEAIINALRQIANDIEQFTKQYNRKVQQ
jgi:hypothetical protein